MNEVFAGKVEKQLTHPKRRQAIFELLGAAFVQRHFPEMENNPSVLVSSSHGKPQSLWKIRVISSGDMLNW